MPAQLLVPLEEYLATSFEDGDREYVEGVLEEKNSGELDHSDVQGLIYNWFFARRKQFGICPLIAVRMRVAPTRFRVPDVTVVRGSKPSGRVITEPALLVVEILSPEDRASRMSVKIDDYLRFGVGSVWVIDPESGLGHIYTAERRISVDDGKYRIDEPPIELDFAALFIE